MSFKIPCGGFKLDEKSFSLDNNDVLSIPKPLTYDYMPEGYPKKGIRPITLMEEQEVTFSNAGSTFLATSPVQFHISVGQLFTVVWDGVEYSCVGHPATEDDNYIGNPALIGLESTSEPFLYLKEGNRYMWASYDTSTSHTIKVIGPQETITPMSADFLPVVDRVIISSSTPDSTKKFKITVDDSGTIKATEVT